MKAGIQTRWPRDGAAIGPTCSRNNIIFAYRRPRRHRCHCCGSSHSAASPRERREILQTWWKCAALVHRRRPGRRTQAELRLRWEHVRRGRSFEEGVDERVPNEERRCTPAVQTSVLEIRAEVAACVTVRRRGTARRGAAGLTCACDPVPAASNVRLGDSRRAAILRRQFADEGRRHAGERASRLEASPCSGAEV